MAYFTAVLSPDGPGDDREWRSVEIDLEAGSPDELGDALRGAVDDDSPVLAVLEREDEWFALVRTDGPIDVKVFVSDAVAAADSAYAPLFAELPTAGDRRWVRIALPAAYSARSRLKTWVRTERGLTLVTEGGRDGDSPVRTHSRYVPSSRSPESKTRVSESWGADGWRARRRQECRGARIMLAAP